MKKLGVTVTGKKAPLRKKTACCALFFTLNLLGACFFIPNVFPKDPQTPIRVGYFHGGRTMLLLRAYENNEFDAAGLPVGFYTTKLRSTEYELIPKSIQKFNSDSGGEAYAGKARGTELTDAIMDGKLDMAMIGESSFIRSMYDGNPIVAIAELGHDVKEHSGHVMLMRKGIKINSPKDFLGKLLVSRRAGPGDAAFLKAFLDKAGVDIKKDVLQLKNSELPRNLKEKKRLPANKVIIVDDLYEDVMDTGLDNGVIDGGYFHLMFLEGVLAGLPVKNNIFPENAAFYLLAPLHAWADPELSHAILVCHKDYLRKNRKSLVKLIEVYIKRIKYEHSLTYAQRTCPPIMGKGFKMACNVFGLNYPQYDIIPTTSVELLYQVKDLLEKYAKFERKTIDISGYVDNSLVLEAGKNLGITEKDDYWQSEY